MQRKVWQISCTCIYLYSCQTDRLVPAKLVRDWKTLFLVGQPLEESKEEGQGSADSLPSSASCEQQRSSDLLDKTDLRDYLVMNVIAVFHVQDNASILFCRGHVVTGNHPKAWKQRCPVHLAQSSLMQSTGYWTL